jgi:Zn-dependent protease with chaperone function/uncharacterized tellurite resistance protein B-like protein
MDFFERQETARRNTKLLVVYFVLGVIGIILAVYLAAGLILNGKALRHHSGTALPSLLWNPQLLLGTATGTIILIFCGSAYKIMALSRGGSAVAEMLGGRPINSDTSDPDERKLLNVVEEMAIASGTPVPQVYVMDAESGINAFAAGHSTSDMVICTTKGCLKFLTRDELQGVIGHEFSHILNGDMRLNLRLMGLVFGILCIAICGRVLLNVRSSGREKDRNPLPLFGIALLVIGGIGVFFGKLIKSAVSRQREFLADAAAVQFTRNPAGLASALKKVGGCGSQISDANAEDASHLFFANGMAASFSSAFSTHPPLEERIRALDPAFDGKFIPVGPQVAYGDPDQTPQTPRRPVPAPQLQDLLGGQALAGGRQAPAMPLTYTMIQVGAPTGRHLDYAADLRSKLPESLTTAARDPMSAVALIYGILLGREESLRTRQLQQLQQQADPGIYRETMRLLPLLTTLESRVKLPLVSLTMTALRRLSPSQYEQFSRMMQLIIESDQQVELFEYTLQKMVLRQLAPNFQPPTRTIVQYYVLKPLVPDCALLLSALAQVGQEDPAQALKAFRQGTNKLGLPNLELISGSTCSLAQIDAALARLNLAALPVKKIVLDACAETVAADGAIQEEEAELLRAIADTLDCPIPPLISLS